MKQRVKNPSVIKKNVIIIILDKGDSRIPTRLITSNASGAMLLPPGGGGVVGNSPSDSARTSKDIPLSRSTNVDETCPVPRSSHWRSSLSV